MKTSLLMIVVLTFAIGVLWLLVSEPQVDIESANYPPLSFKIKTSKINYVMGLAFYSDTDKEYVWYISNKSRGSIDQVVYGTLPPGTIQNIPKDGQPRRLRASERVRVCVSYQYDSMTAACAGARIWAFEIESDKNAKLLGDFSKTTLPAFPERE
jgi:hypothetical protein